MDKVCACAAAAVADIPDGATIMAGGFGLCGNPENLIRALHARGVKQLTIVSNNCGTDDRGLGILLAAGQVRKMVSSYVGENKIFERRFLGGELEVELVPQGTLAERIRAGGAGIPAFYTPTGHGTQVALGGLPMLYGPGGAVLKASPPKEMRVVGGVACVLEHALRADFAIVKAWRGDRFGNLAYRKTARNFNPMMAAAAAVTIAEVEELVEPGQLDPDLVHTPSVFVQRIVQGERYEKPIEQRCVRPRAGGGDHAPA
jgi:3-oxoacid CoA-transferase/3-oxoacid CoA-transferase subunit A